MNNTLNFDVLTDVAKYHPTVACRLKQTCRELNETIPRPRVSPLAIERERAIYQDFVVGKILSFTFAFILNQVYSRDYIGDFYTKYISTGTERDAIEWMKLEDKRLELGNVNFFYSKAHLALESKYIAQQDEFSHAIDKYNLFIKIFSYSVLGALVFRNAKKLMNAKSTINLITQVAQFIILTTIVETSKYHLNSSDYKMNHLRTDYCYKYLKTGCSLIRAQEITPFVVVSSLFFMIVSTKILLAENKFFRAYPNPA